MSEEIDELRKGGIKRILVVVAVLAAIAVAIAWARASADHGEPELAHRVLIIGGTPTDLVEVIAEAGFVATQISWDEAQTQCADPQGNFDVETVVVHADEHGYGFVALMFGDDMPFEPAIFGAPAPEHTMAAVISIGELAPILPEVQYGGPPDGLDYAPGVRRSEALRMALYEHPHLLALWDEPTRDQLLQQVQLGDLEHARRLLDAALVRYRASVATWSEQSFRNEATAVLVRNGRLTRERPLSVRVDPQRRIELHRGELQLRFVSNDGKSTATTIDPQTRWFIPSNGAVGLQRTHSGVVRWRFDGEVPTREGEVDIAPRFTTLSTEGSLLGFDEDTMEWSTASGRRGELAMIPKFMPRPADDTTRVAPVWLDDEVASLAGWYVDNVYWLGLLDLGDPDGPKLAALSISELAPMADGTLPTIGGLYPSAAGLYVLLDDLSPTFEKRQQLVRVEFDPTDLRAAMVRIAGDPPLLDDAAMSSAARTLGQLGERTKIVDLGVMPSFIPGSLVVAPDGTWLAWRTPGEAGAIRAAAIVDGALATPVRLGESLSDPQISADSQTVLLTVERELPDLGAFHFPNLVPRPRP